MGYLSESVVERVKNLTVPSIPRQLLLAVILAIIGAVLFGPQPSLDYTFQQVGNIFLDLFCIIILHLSCRLRSSRLHRPLCTLGRNAFVICLLAFCCSWSA